MTLDEASQSKQRSLGARILSAFALFVVILSAILIAQGVSLGLRQARQSAVERLDIVATLKQQQIERWVDERGTDLAVLSDNPALVENLTVFSTALADSPERRLVYSEISVQLSDFLQSKLAFTELLLVDAESGVALISTDILHEGEPVTGVGEMEQNTQGIRYHQPSSEAGSGLNGGGAFLITAPVRDPETGALLAVLVGRANLLDLGEVINEMGGVEETGATYLVDLQQRIVASSRAQQIQGQQVESEGVRSVLQGRSGWALYDDEAGDKVIGAYRWLERLGLGLMIEQDYAVVTQVGTRLILRNIVVAGLALLVVAGFGLVINRVGVQPLTRLTQAATAVANGDLQQHIDIDRRDEIGRLALAFNSMTAQLRELVAGLEQRVDERTEELRRRSAYLQGASDVSRAVASILDIDRLVRRVTDLILQSFKLYHVGLYLVDESGAWAEYRAGTGAAGAAILEERLRLEVGGRSMVGWSIAHAQTRVAEDVSDDTVRMAHPLLPDTRSEAALPLVARGKVIGALNVQSDVPNAFSADVINVLETMADQVALAIENARLLQESQEALEAMRQVYGELSQEAWAKMVQAQGGLAYRSEEGENVRAIPSDWKTEQAWLAKRSQPEGSLVAVPITFRERVLGVLKLRKPAGAGRWTEDQVALAETLGDRLSQALESARLYQESQRRAARERLIRDVTANIRQTLEMDTVLRTGMDEIFQALDLDQIIVRLASELGE